MGTRGAGTVGGVTARVLPAIRWLGCGNIPASGFGPSGAGFGATMGFGDWDAEIIPSQGLWDELGEVFIGERVEGRVGEAPALFSMIESQIDICVG